MKLLLYCTKAKPYLLREDIDKDLIFIGTNKTDVTGNILNGKIVAECDYEIEEIIYRETTEKNNYSFGTNSINPDELLANTSLTTFELCQYIGTKENWTKGKYGYAIHIKNLHIFDKPKQLSDYYTFDSKQHININYCKPIIKAPQNMMYCWSLWQDSCVIGNRYFYENILISIRPEWLCKILNGEKTIEVRKKVLKEM